MEACHISERRKPGSTTSRLLRTLDALATWHPVVDSPKVRRTDAMRAYSFRWAACVLGR